MSSPTGIQYPTYRSKFGPRYHKVPHVGGWTVSQAVKFGARAAGFGAAAGIGALFFTSGIPRIQRDILMKVPVIGQVYVKEIPPSDNPF